PKPLWSYAQLPVNTSSSRSPSGVLSEISRQSAAWAAPARVHEDRKRMVRKRTVAPSPNVRRMHGKGGGHYTRRRQGRVVARADVEVERVSVGTVRPARAGGRPS